MMEDDKENEYLLPIMQSKIDVQNQIITLMQTQVDMQDEKITKQNHEIEKLASELAALKVVVDQLISNKSSLSTTCTVLPAFEKPKPEQSNSKEGGSNITSIADMARQTAEATLANSGFVYDETSGLYFDYSTGYYYDPTRKLYYDGHTRTYYSYDEASSQYVFHSRLPEVLSSKKKKKKLKTKGKPSTESPVLVKLEYKKPKSNHSASNVIDLEDGELTEDDDCNIIEKEDLSSSDSDDTHGTVEIDSDGEETQRKVEENTPCIRAIVLQSESTVPRLKKGFLFIVTCMGGSIGREGSHHSVLITDELVSKEHAKFTYEFQKATKEEGDEETKKSDPVKKYFITDLGSQNGTFLNKQRLSSCNTESESYEITHGSILQISDTQLLIHIHNGTMTCGHCEPGLLLSNEKEVVILNESKSAAQKEAVRKKILKKIRQKYAISSTKGSTISKMEKYKDRAQDRRRLLGSDHHAFKLPEAEPASIHVPIDKENKGFKMLKKMGWTAGESLGQSKEDAIREPVKFQVKVGRSGLGVGVEGHGMDGSGEPPPTHHPRGRKLQFLEKTRQSQDEDEYLTADGEVDEEEEPELQVTRQNTPTPKAGGDADEFFEKIDAMLEGDESRQHQAYLLLQQKEHLYKKSSEFLWRLAKATHFEGTVAKTNGNKKLKQETYDKA